MSQQTPEFASTLHKQNHTQQLIDETIDEINKLGETSITAGSMRVSNAMILSAIDQISTYMKQFSDELRIQRVCCHTLSTLSMDIMVAQFIIQKDAFQLIEQALTKFGPTDYQICWFAASAVWNLSRPRINRDIIGERGVQLMINILKSHANQEKVANTAIGALSNLCLHDELKDVITNKDNLDVIMNVLSEYFTYRKITPVMTNGVGLIANLAISDKHAETLVSEYNVTALLFELLNWCINCNDEQNARFTRNVCVALNNVVNVKSFLSSFLECNGVETIFKFLETSGMPLYCELLEQVLINVDVDKNSKITSLHLCCIHGCLDIIKKRIQQNPLLNLNQVDDKNMSLLDYAISMNHPEIVHLLAKCGAVQYQRDYQQNKNELLNEVYSGTTKLNHSKNNVYKAIIESVPELPTELSHFIIQFSSNVDILQGNNQF